MFGSPVTKRAGKKPIVILLLYDAEDKRLCSGLIKHLALWQRQGGIQVLDDAGIDRGKDLPQPIETYIKKANVIVFLLSADLIASDSFQKIVQAASRRVQKSGGELVPVRLRDIDLSLLDPPLVGLKLLPEDGRPISKRKDRDTAFVEVVEGIKKVVEKLRQGISQPPSRTDVSARTDWNVPYWPNDYFTGREEKLIALHDYFFSRAKIKHTRMQAISGPPGIGKTQLAVEYVYTYYNKYIDEERKNVFWISGESSMLFQDDIIALANRLALDEERDDIDCIFRKVRNWLYQHTKWLLVIDNLEDMSTMELLKQLVPNQCKGHVLLTTQNHAIVSLVHTVSLESLTDDEGALFLLRRAHRLDQQATLEEADPQEAFYARLIAQELEGIPLALDQAGAYMGEVEVSPGDYLTIYQQQGVDLLKWRGQSMNGHPHSVTTTLLLSFEKVERTNAAAMELLRLFSFLHPDAIPDDLIRAGADALDEPLRALATNHIEFSQANTALLKFSLVYRNAGISRMHRIVQVVLRHQFDDEQQRQWITRAVRMVSHAFPEVDYSTIKICLRYLAQAEKCAAYISQQNLTFYEAATLLRRLGTYYYERAQYREAEEHLMHALRMYEQLCESGCIEIAKNLNALALLYNEQGEFQKAKECQTKALDMHERLLGPDHIETAVMLNDLACIYEELEQYTQAEALFQRALATHERVSEPEPEQMALTLTNLAGMYQDLDRYNEAEELLKRALSIRTQMLEQNHPNLAHTVNMLASLYRSQGKFDQAERLYQQAVRSSEEALGPTHPETAVYICNLGNLYCMQGKYEQARPLLQQAVAIHEQTLGPEHTRTAKSLNNLGLFYRKQGALQQAEEYYQRALAIYEKTFGETHTDTALLAHNLGTLYLIQEKYQQAEQLLQRAVSIYTEIRGAENSETASSLSELAKVYAAQQKYEQAEQLHRRAIAISKHALGSEHPDTLLAINNYASFRAERQQDGASSIAASDDATQPAQKRTVENASDETT